MNKIQIHYYTWTQNSNQSNGQNVASPTVEKAEVALSARKAMVCVFWNCRGLIFIDYLQNGKTTKSDYYASLLGNFEQYIKAKRPHLKKKMLIYHKSVIAITEVHTL